MHHHLEILEDIDNILAINRFEEERKQLKSEIAASATGGELCARCGSWLLILQNDSSRSSLVVGNLIKEFIAYCYANNIYLK